jgi:hypothetical protein
MKLEITKTTELTGTFYNVISDGWTVDRFKVTEERPDDMTKELAMKQYQRCLDVAVKGITTEVIKSTEI